MSKKYYRISDVENNIKEYKYSTFTDIISSITKSDIDVKMSIIDYEKLSNVLENDENFMLTYLNSEYGPILKVLNIVEQPDDYLLDGIILNTKLSDTSQNFFIDSEIILYRFNNNIKVFKDFIVADGYTNNVDEDYNYYHTLVPKSFVNTDLSGYSIEIMNNLESSEEIIEKFNL